MKFNLIFYKSLNIRKNYKKRKEKKGMLLKFAPIAGLLSLTSFCPQSKSISSSPTPTVRHAICILYPNNSLVTGRERFLNFKHF